jgi:hypothetical protein
MVTGYGMANMNQYEKRRMSRSHGDQELSLHPENAYFLNPRLNFCGQCRKNGHIDNSMISNIRNSLQS